MKKILLVVVLMFVAGSFMLNEASAQRKNPGEFKSKERAIEKLNLNDSQKSEVEEMRINHRKEMIDLKANLEKAEVALKEVKLKKDFSRDEYISAVEKINDSRNAIAIARANHRMDVYSILDDNQKEEWLKMGDNFHHKRFMMGDGMHERRHNRF